MPPSGARNASPVMTTSWHRGEATGTGGIGFAIAASQAAPISAVSRRIPSE